MNTDKKMSTLEIKNLLKSKGLTLKEVATMWSRSEGWMSKLINNPNRPIYWDCAFLGLNAKKGIENLIQIKKKDTLYNSTFYAIKWNGETFKSIKTNIAYILYLKQHIDNNCDYEIAEKEILELYKLIFGTTCIVQPYSQKLGSQSFLFIFDNFKNNTPDIPSKDLNRFIKNRTNIDNDFNIVKKFIINNNQ